MAAVQWYQAVHTSKPRFRVGTIKKDITGCEFIYGTGVTANALGKWVTFTDGTYTPVLTTNASLTGDVAISMSANLSSVTNQLSTPSTVNWSWYMIKGSSKLIPNLTGLVQIDTGSTDKASIATSSGTTGRVTGGGVVATKTVVGAYAIGVSAANLGDALLAYPVVAGGSLA